MTQPLRHTSGLWLWIVSRAIVVGGVVAVALLFIVYTLAAPYRDQRNQLASYRADLQSHQETLVQHQLDWKAFADSLSDLSTADIRLVAESIPAQPAVPELLVQLEGLTKAFDFRIASISFHDASVVADTHDRLMALPLTIKVVGPSYAAFQRLLGGIQNHIRLFDVKAIYFTPKTPEYTIDFVTYYLASS